MSPAAPPRRALDQVAALPARLDAEGLVEVMLITSRETNRWIIPKDWAISELDPHEVAAKAAGEEAGLIGIAGTGPIGHFTYDNRLSSGMVLPCRVAVHLFRVTGQLDRWAGRGRREIAWLSSREAAKRVCNLTLQRLIARIGRSPEFLRPIMRRAMPPEKSIGQANVA
jgi:ADP-ribose pyrophosphatase YjhB (NUDIX family)